MPLQVYDGHTQSHAHYDICIEFPLGSIRTDGNQNLNYPFRHR